MNHSTIAIITAATEHKWDIATNTHVQMFFWSMRPSECMPWILLSCNFGDLYASGMQDAEVNKVTAYFFGMDKKLLDNFVLEFNQWKYQMSFIACACRFSRSYTVYSLLIGYWAFGHTKQCNDFPEGPPNNSLPLLNCEKRGLFGGKIKND